MSKPIGMYFKIVCYDLVLDSGGIEMELCAKMGKHKIKAGPPSFILTNAHTVIVQYLSFI